MSRLPLAILRAGLVVGTLDWMAAVGVFLLRGGSDPARVFAFIASGVLGPDAFTGEPWVPYLGFFLHYLIAYSWTTAFFLAYPRIRLLQSSPWVVGIGYGAVIWTVMNLVVLPLSKIGSSPLKIVSVAIGMSVLMLCIGVPLAFLARQHHR